MITGDMAPPEEMWEAAGIENLWPLIGGHEGAGVDLNLLAKLGGEMMAEAVSLAGKGGTIVVTAIAPMTQGESSINLFESAMWNREIKGTIFGSLNPRADIPRLLSMNSEGTLKLDELITSTSTLDDINEGYRAMRDGENIRGVVAHG